MNFIIDNVWDELIKNWQSEPRYLAIAYFSCDKGLSFGSEDVLIVDATDGAISSGQTDARALRKAYQSGASVYSLPKLHAKIYVLGDQIFIGSANSSVSSRESLVECLASSKNPHAVSEGINIVLALREAAEQVDEKFLKHIETIPVIRNMQGGSTRGSRINVSQPRCWLVGVHPADYPGNGTFIDKESDVVKKRMSKSDEKVDWFWWTISKQKFVNEAKPGDLVIQISSPSRNPSDTDEVLVYRHARICEITKEEGVNAKAFHAAWTSDSDDTAQKWEDFLALLKKADMSITPSLNSCREIPIEKSKLLAELWPNH